MVHSHFLLCIPIDGAFPLMVHSHWWCIPTDGAFPLMVHSHWRCIPNDGAFPLMVHSQWWCIPNDSAFHWWCIAIDSAFLQYIDILTDCAFSLTASGVKCSHCVFRLSIECYQDQWDLTTLTHRRQSTWTAERLSSHDTVDAWEHNTMM